MPKLTNSRGAGFLFHVNIFLRYRLALQLAFHVPLNIPTEAREMDRLTEGLCVVLFLAFASTGVATYWHLALAVVLIAAAAR